MEVDYRWIGRYVLLRHSIAIGGLNNFKIRLVLGV